MEKIKEVFKLLDKWRELPAYQLERRADIFFAVYIEKIIKNNKQLSVDSNDELEIIPEFPILKKLYDTEIKDYSSVKIDYFIFNKTNPNNSFFVELKTEMTSRNPKQDYYLKQASTLGIKTLIEKGIIQIFAHSDDYRKYFKLLECLNNIGLVSNEINIIKNSNFIPKKGEHRAKGWTKKIENIIENVKVLANCYPKVVYIQPLKHEGESADIEISFNEIIDAIEDKTKNQNDPLLTIFCESLNKWQTNE